MFPFRCLLQLGWESFVSQSLECGITCVRRWDHFLHVNLKYLKCRYLPFFSSFIDNTFEIDPYSILCPLLEKNVKKGKWNLLAFEGQRDPAIRNQFGYTAIHNRWGTLPLTIIPQVYSYVFWPMQYYPAFRRLACYLCTGCLETVANTYLLYSILCMFNKHTPKQVDGVLPLKILLTDAYITCLFLSLNWW